MVVYAFLPGGFSGLYLVLLASQLRVRGAGLPIPGGLPIRNCKKIAISLWRAVAVGKMKNAAAGGANITAEGKVSRAISPRLCGITHGDCLLAMTTDQLIEHASRLGLKEPLLKNGRFQRLQVLNSCRFL